MIEIEKPGRLAKIHRDGLVRQKEAKLLEIDNARKNITDYERILEYNADCNRGDCNAKICNLNTKIENLKGEIQVLETRMGEYEVAMQTAREQAGAWWGQWEERAKRLQKEM